MKTTIYNGFTYVHREKGTLVIIKQIKISFLGLSKNKNELTLLNPYPSNNKKTVYISKPVDFVLSYVFSKGHYSWNFTRISLNRKEIQRVVLIPLMPKISFEAYLHIHVPVSKAEELMTPKKNKTRKKTRKKTLLMQFLMPSFDLNS
jgi:hypothetical protein